MHSIQVEHNELLIKVRHKEENNYRVYAVTGVGVQNWSSSSYCKLAVECILLIQNISTKRSEIKNNTHCNIETSK